MLPKHSSSGLGCKSDRVCGFRWAGGCWAIATLALRPSRAHQPPRVPLPRGWQCASSPTQVSPYPTEPGLCVPPGLYLRQFSPNHTSAGGDGFTRGTASAIAARPRSLSRPMGMPSPAVPPAGGRSSTACPGPSCFTSVEAMPHDYNWSKLEQALKVRDWMNKGGKNITF